MTDKKYQAAYQRGYRAGMKAGKGNNWRMTDSQFFDEAMLRLLPVAMAAENWTMGGERVATGEQRVALCVVWAKESVKQRGKDNG